MRSLIAPVAAFALLSGCAASIPRVEVTRFHLGQPIAPGAVLLEPLTPGDSRSLEWSAYAAAVGRAMAGAGLRAGEGTATPWIATIGVTRDTRASAQRRSPVTIGVGGGTGGWNSGIGVGASFGVGGSGARQIVVTRLSVRLVKRADRSTVWEGRAETQAPTNAPAAQPGLAAEKLANALFAGFPGESGKTITVP